MFYVNRITHCLFSPFSLPDKLLRSSVDKLDNSLHHVSSKRQWQDSLLAFIMQNEPEKIESFFKLLPSLIVEKLSSSIPRCEYENFNFLQELENEKFLLPLLTKMPSRLNTDYKIVNFFVNFIENLLSALNFFDGKDPPSTFYEKYVGIQIYCQFFTIPIVIVNLLQPVVFVAWKVYVFTLAIIFSTVNFLYLYVKYLRNFPKIIPYCENMADSVAKKYPFPIRGLDREFSDLIARLNAPLLTCHHTTKEPHPILLLSKTGQGKTTLIYKLCQTMILNPEKVPKSIRGKKILLLNAGELVAKSNYGIVEKIETIKKKLTGFENEVVLFIDEIQAFTEDLKSMEIVKQLFRHPSIQIIAATTLEDLTKIKNKDKDGSFLRPFNAIIFQEWSHEQIKVLLKEVIYRQACDIVVENDAVEKILELSNELTSKLSQPTKALKLLDLAIRSCRANVDTSFSEDYTKIKLELDQLRYNQAIAYPQVSSADFCRIQELQSALQRNQQSENSKLIKINKLKKLIKFKQECIQKLKNDVNEMIDLQTQKKTISIEKQKKYFFIKFYLLPVLNESIKRLVDELKDKIDLVVDANFVQKTFKIYQQSENEIENNV